jgi:hypothetical protein
MRGVQGADAKNNYLLVPHLFPKDKNDSAAFWKGLDLQKSFKYGMEAAGLPYSGEYKWIHTRLHRRIQHGVMPKEYALSCVSCHKSLTRERTCNRCHRDKRDVKFEELSRKGIDFKELYEKGYEVENLVNITDYINFKKLGYRGDPILYGGRFKKLPLDSSGKEELTANR